MPGLKFMQLYHSYLDAIEPLGDAERGRLFTACLEYSKTGALPELSGNERFIFPMIRGQIDRDNEAYAEKRQQNSQNGKLGGRPTKKPDGFQESDSLNENPGLFEKAKKAKEKEKDAPLPPKKSEPLLGAREYLVRLGHAPPPGDDKYFVLLEAMFELADTFPEDQRDRDYVYKLFSEFLEAYGDRNILRTVRNLADHQRASSPRTNKGKPYVRLGATLRNWLDNERPEIEEGSGVYERVQ
jgi:hypothetical protein